ncbi:ankyrin repeat and SOCS box protein 2-like [Bacillus rossius redtenbacheri]|uniref:ankyrin repeat and SOCS box protein 2-like n=1 Tax=Bacillus rossius redtenbacheri TaxID=93214 RepID=UPI002FDE0C1A
MPLQGHFIAGPDYQPDIRNILGEVVNLVKNVAASLEKLSAENVDLKLQIKSVGNQLGTVRADFDAFKNEMDNSNKNVKNVAASMEKLSAENVDLKLQIKSVLDTVRADFDAFKNEMDNSNKNVYAILSTIKEDCTYCRSELAQSSPEQRSSSESSVELITEIPKQLLEAYRSTKDWAALRRGLEAVLHQDSAARKQLQGIQSVRSGFVRAWPLYEVGEKGHLELATTLLSHGVLVDVKDQLGCTMLHGAAGMGHLPVVELLLCRGATVDARSSIGRTPLMLAAESGHLEVVQRLVLAGASLTAQCNSGRTALDSARNIRQTPVVQWLSQQPQ